VYLIKRKLRFSDISPICFFARHLGVIRSLIRKTLTGALFHPASVPSFIIRKSTGKTYDKRLTTNDVPVPYNKHDESPLQTCLSFIVYYRLSIWCRRLSRVLLIGSNRPGNSLLRTTVNRQNQYIPHSEPPPPPLCQRNEAYHESVSAASSPSVACSPSGLRLKCPNLSLWPVGRKRED